MITIDNKKVTDITIGNKVVSRIVDQETDEVIFEKGVLPQNEYFYIENRYNGSNTVTLTTHSIGSPSSSNYSDTVQYSKDKNTWTTVTFDPSTPTTISLSQGEKVYFRNNNGKWNYYYNTTLNYYTRFYASQSHNVGGNIKSLLDYQNMDSVSLKNYCFSYLFLNDSGLVSAGSLVLPSTLIDGCFSDMFRSCTALTTAPNLPATVLANSCYSWMFNGCTALTTAPNLPATTLAQHCYNRLFYGCTSLTTAPTLPATTLANYCYSSMFNSCSSLTTAPILPATTLVPHCYDSMFSGCSSLNSVTVYADDNSATDCTTSWLQNVAATGTFHNLGSATYTADSASGIPTGWTELRNCFYIENTYNGTNTVTLTTKSSGSPSSSNYSDTVQYSKDMNVWTTATFNTFTPLTISLSQGEKVYFRNNNGKFNYYYYNNFTYYYTTFTATQSHNVGGNINSLLDYQNMYSVNLKVGCFYSLFSYNTTLVNAGSLVLPTTTLTNDCYNSMFYRCSSLTAAPSLPATTLASRCYQNMFNGCSLTTTPSLPITTLAEECYNGMFSGCSSLTTAPSLPATTLVKGCYGYMFSGCSSLTTAPSLPATTLAANCYDNMFTRCSSLTAAPSLPATTLPNYCYNYMFSYCSSLTTTPVISATTAGYMSLVDMFNGCTSLTTAQSISITTLGQYCCRFMFQNCTALETAPALPATTLVKGCYQGMFKGCTSLNSVTIYADDNSATDCTANWLDSVAASGTFHNLGSATYTADSASGIPTGWTEVYV